MDVHPTPFPGKRRPAAANSTTKDGERVKPSKKPQPQALASAPTRPKRAFGVARSANIPAEKPLSKPSSTKTCKPWKPSGNSTKPVKIDDPAVAVTKKEQKVNENVARGESSKTKSGTKKHQHVSFQDPVAAAAVDSEAKIVEQQEGIHTPMSSIKSSAPDTPYHSAQDCSDCMLDKLESAMYWLAQIRLAESVGRHSVTAAFFRLALECQAQPFHRLQIELKHYAARHQVGSAESMWSDLCKAFGLSNDELVKFDDSLAGKEDQVICEANKSGGLDYDGDDNPVVDEAEEAPVKDMDANTTDLKDGSGKEETTEAKPELDASEDCFHEKKNSGVAMVSHGSAEESLEENASGKRSCVEKSNRGSRLSIKSSSLNAKPVRSGGSADKGRFSSSKNQSASKFSAREQMTTKMDGAKRDEGGQLRSKDNSSDNFNSDISGEDAIINQSA